MPLTRSKSPTRSPLQERRESGRGVAELIAQLQSDDAMQRRRAARDLGGCVDALPALEHALARETVTATRQTMLTALMSMDDERVATMLLPMLRSDDVALRNDVIEVLQSLPGLVAPHMSSLLEDEDSDVRIFAVNILESLRHPDVPRWLQAVIEHDEHVNVCAAAVDVLTDVGDVSALPALDRLPQRFPDHPFIHFAANMAAEGIRRGDDV